MNEEEFIRTFGEDDGLNYEELLYEDSSGLDIEITIEAHE
tara:strand:+ start:694 stop:813 length:120 start_codon:yes stop_codon:yes gene_type:complete